MRQLMADKHGNILVSVFRGSIERVDEFKYLGTTLKNKNSIHEEIKGRLKSGDAC